MEIVSFGFWCFLYAQNLFVKNKLAWNCLDSFNYYTTERRRKKFSKKLRDLREAMPRHWSLCFLVSPCYSQGAMPFQWSSRDLPRVLRIWESVFYPLNSHYSVSYFLVFHLYSSNFLSFFCIITFIQNRNKFFMTYFHVNRCLWY